MRQTVYLTENDMKTMVASGLVNLLVSNPFTLDKKEKVQLKQSDPQALMNAPVEFKKYLDDAVAIRTRRSKVGPQTKSDYQTCVGKCAENYRIASAKCLKLANEYLKKDPRYMTILKRIAVDIFKVLNANSEQ